MTDTPWTWLGIIAIAVCIGSALGVLAYEAKGWWQQRQARKGKPDA